MTSSSGGTGRSGSGRRSPNVGRAPADPAADSGDGSGPAVEALLDPPELPDGHRAVLGVLVDNDWAQGCTALELTYLLSRWRFPMEASVSDVSARAADLARWGLVEVVAEAPDWPAAADRFRITGSGRTMLA